MLENVLYDSSFGAAQSDGIKVLCTDGFDLENFPSIDSRHCDVAFVAFITVGDEDMFDASTLTTCNDPARQQRRPQ
jgi:hypothetical protein